MADETAMINGGDSEDQTVNITGDESADSEPKVAQLSQKIAALEQEKKQLVHENEIVNDRIKKLKESVKESNAENEDLKSEKEKLGDENRALQSVVGRAAELEAQVSRLQHDLISAVSDLEEANKEASEWKAKAVKFDAIKNERDLLIAKLEIVEVRKREKEEEIRNLQRKIEELELANEETVEALELKVEEKERMISVLEEKQREIVGGLNGKADIVEEDRGSTVVEGREKGNFIGGLQVDWPVVVSLVSAAAVTGVVCYLHARKR